MKKTLQTSLILSLISLPALAKEMDGTYGKLLIGYGHAANYVINHSDTANQSGKKKARGNGFVGAAAVGYGFGNGFRPELELLVNDGVKGKKTIYNTKHHVKIQSTIAFLNGYIDFATSSKMSPFILGGIGFGHTKSELGSDYGKTSSKKSSMDFQLGLGASYAITDKAKFEFVKCK